MSQSHNKSFLAILAFIFLTPIFFIPGGSFYLDSAKTAFFSISTALLTLIFLYELIREKRLRFPSHATLIAVVLLPIMYLTSHLVGSSTTSLVGYGFEVGTFGYVTLAGVVLILTSIIVSDTSRILQALTAFFLSILVILICVSARMLLGTDFLVLGNFFTKMDNPLGNWTDLTIVFGLLSVFSSITLGMLPMKKPLKILLYITCLLSASLMFIVNFSVAFILTLIFSLLFIIYTIRVEKGSKISILVPVILIIVSGIFLFNPSISAEKGKLGSFVSSSFGLNNAEVRPSLMTTLGIAKEVLKKDPLLGSGPSTFKSDWFLYRPASINQTPFWANEFPSGYGFLPTELVSLGALGAILWLIFLVSLVLLSVKAIRNLPASKPERFVIISTMFGSLFLWSASFFYTPSAATLMLSYIFTGLFIGALAHGTIINTYILNFGHSGKQYLVGLALSCLIFFSALCLGYTGFKKALASYHFKQAATLSQESTPPLSDIEYHLKKALSYAPDDVYYLALSRVSFAKVESLAMTPGTTPDEFKAALSQTIESAKAAVATNPSNYQNWITLGNVYAALVPKPLEVDGAYENAKGAYAEASNRNPNSPEVALLTAKVLLSKGDVEGAQAELNKAITLKSDYSDVYLLLGILKYSANDFSGAIQAFSQAVSINQNDGRAKYYLGVSLAQLGRFSEAKAVFENILQSDPNNAELKSALSDISAGKVPRAPSTNPLEP
ncbi:tetratricopeptide repeat protein [Candidatus Parcubacteria bacterium]|nr:tetratricopeptide repeat protein [Candidatus Parcubacteria bacterium]